MFFFCFFIDGTLPEENSEIFIHSAGEYLGKAEDIETIRTFCNNTEGPRLLYINGLPGAGKKELLLKALSTIDRRKIIEPNFYDREDSMANWTCEEFLTHIAKTWMSRFDVDLRRATCDSLLQEFLTSKEEKVFLILKLGPLFGDMNAARNIWSFIYNITQSNTGNLKVIVSSCKHPEEILIKDSKEFVQIALRGLDKKVSIDFLQRSNPKLKNEHGKNIWQFFGGNPFFLLKINANLKQFQNFDEDVNELIDSITCYLKRNDYVRRLVQRTDWWGKMRDVIEMMDDNERVVLAKLSVFKGIIPKCLLSIIFKDNETTHEAWHLYTYHCILDIHNKGKAYYLAPVYRVFVSMYAKEDSKIRCYITDEDGKNSTLQEIKENAFSRVVECYNGILSSLSNLFFNEDVNLDECTEKLIEEYQKNCLLCQNEEKTALCLCSNVKIVLKIFNDLKTMLITSFEDYYDNQYRKEEPEKLDLVKVFLFWKIMSQNFIMKFQPFDESKMNVYDKRDSLSMYFYRYLLKVLCERTPLTLERITKYLATLSEKKLDERSYRLVKCYLQLAKAKAMSIAGRKYDRCIAQIVDARKTFVGLDLDMKNEWFTVPSTCTSNAVYHYLQTAGGECIVDFISFSVLSSNTIDLLLT